MPGGWWPRAEFTRVSLSIKRPLWGPQRGPSSSDLRSQGFISHASGHVRDTSRCLRAGYPVCPQGLRSDQMAFSLQGLAWPLQ